MHADLLHLLQQLFQHVALGVVRALQGSQHLAVLRHLRPLLAQAFARAAALAFRLLQLATQLIAEIVVAVQHAGGVAVAEVGAALHHFRQRERLLTRDSLLLLRLLIVRLQLFVLFGIALQHADQRLELRQLRAVLMQEARRLLRLFDLLAGFVAAIGQRIVQQQIDARQQAV